MSKRTLTIIIVLICLIFIGVGIWLYLRNRSTTTTPTNTLPSGNVFPSGSTRPITDTSTTGATNQTGTNLENLGEPTGSLQGSNLIFRQLTNVPIAGASFLLYGSTTTLMYMERTTGNLYRIDPLSREAQRISNSTLPRTYAVTLGSDKGTIKLVSQTIKNNGLENYAATLLVSSSTVASAGENAQNLDGKVLEAGITQVVVAPKADRALYVSETSGATTLSTGDLLHTKLKTLITLPETEFLATWPTDNIIALQTKASYYVPGFLYFINTSGGKTSILSNVTGLTTLTSPDTKQVLFADNTVAATGFSLYRTTTRTTLGTNVATLPEKCVWTKDSKTLYCAVPKTMPQSDYPDSWYRGEVTFSDALWQVDAATGNAKLLYDPNASGLSIDGTNLFLNAKENMLFLTNKQDLTLWELDLASFAPTPPAPAPKATTTPIKKR